MNRNESTTTLNSINSLALQFQDLKLDDFRFAYTVPQLVDPDPITCIMEPSQEEGGLYVGGYEAAKDYDLLRRLRIRAVFTASSETPIEYPEYIVQFHQIIQAHDKDDYDIRMHADNVFEFIERHRKHTNVFVHCFIGISRSVSLITMYLMRKYNLNLEKALWKIKQKRRQINPNTGFMKQLAEYEKSLNKPKQQQQGFFKMIRQQGVPQSQIMGSPQMSTIVTRQLVNPDVQLSRISYQRPPQQFYTQFINNEYKK